MIARILISNRSEHVRNILASFFRHHGVETLEAVSTGDACRLAAAERPHVIVTDFDLSPPHGDCACEMLRSDPAVADIPIVVWTSLVLPEVVHRVEAAGAVFLAKPTLPADVMRLVEALAHRESRAAEQLPPCPAAGRPVQKPPCACRGLRRSRTTTRLHR